MANDRMAIVCPCGGYRGLAKHFGTEWQAYDLPAWTETLDAFFLEHHWCVQGSGGKHYRIKYESDVEA